MLHVPVDWNQRVVMRDGVELSADVYHPPDNGRHTTVIARTPYLKNNPEQQLLAQIYADHGYNFVWMDVRGRGDSDGEFVPWVAEGIDGYDSIEWIAEQPWSDGRVVTWGASYLGIVQWLTALERPPHLSAMMVLVPPSDPWEDMPTGMHIPWEICWFRMLDGRVQQHVEEVDWPAIFWHLPLYTMDEAAGFRSEHWRRNLENPITDATYWDPVRYQAAMTSVDVPVLHVSGWYDDVQRGTTVNYTRMTADPASEKIGASQWLLMGPWDHRLTMVREQTLGRLDFGPGAELDLRAFELEWLEEVLGDKPEASESARVRLFVMGKNEWRDENEWPIARTRWTDYYLQSAGGANTRLGDGRLERDTQSGAGAASDSFVYDPADPVPFLSDHASSMQIGGPDDYVTIEERDDVLVYTTELLDAEREVTGPVRAVIYASSSARDTDFTAKLIDVHPDGFCQRVCDGMVRGRFRNGFGEPEQLLQPGEVVEYEIDMWSTSHVFSPGHRIRLEVSSSAFPKYDRNLNTGGPIATETEMMRANNEVWHDAARPSRLILPEIPA
ncbi:MAG: uncharacterized protein QOH16_156 [Gaiellaceae bacterium]|nr:uncharacterized protein [Gaiellaceae bacterium]